jgi:hypothetical protein
LATLDEMPTGMSWGPGGILIGQRSRGIVRVPAEGGPAERIIDIAQGGFVQGPQMLPDGNTVLFTLATGPLEDRWDKADIVAHSLADGSRRVLLKGGTFEKYPNRAR